MYLPPDSNTGVVNTRETNMDNNLEFMDNGLLVSVDWLSFTLSAFDNVEDVLSFLGFDPRYFLEMPKGANGYKRMRKYANYNISILYDGTEDMGIHVNVSGIGIHALLSAFRSTLRCDTPFGEGFNLFDETVLSILLSEITKSGHLTRLDIAIDDKGANYYSLDDIEDRLKHLRVVTKFRSHRHMIDKTTLNEKIGHTIYFGSRQSDIMLRIYDKKLEQNKNLLVSDDRYVSHDWVRWELELHRDRANAVSEYLIAGKSLGDVAIGVLSQYFRIIDLTDTNRSRCLEEITWQLFASGVQKLGLYVSQREKTIEDKKRWIDKFVAPSLSLVTLYEGGDISYLKNLVYNNVDRISFHDRELLRNFEMQ